MQKRKSIIQPRIITGEQLLTHAVRTFLATFFAILGTLFIGAVFGPLAGVMPPQIGINTGITAMAHYLLLVALFSIAAAGSQIGIRVNPYITLTEWIFNRQINFIIALVEIVAQTAGAAGAGGLVYGVLVDTPGFIPGVGGDVINTALGWAFFLECLAGFVLGLVYFRHYATNPNFPTLFALTIAMSLVFTYPFLGPTTHNPLRWLDACIIEQTCGNYGSWVYPVAPAIGIPIGYFVQSIIAN